MHKLRFFKEYLIEKYGKPLYRIPIDLPLGCPNRNNDFGEGCIYCAEDGNRARHLKHKLDIPQQARSGIDFAVKRYGAEAPYIAYFQSFTNTYGNAAELKKFYYEALACADFKMVIIGTRPDCISNEALDLLKEINSKYELWVELGVQTSNEKTLKLIRRGHDFEAVKTAATKLAAAGISCAAHVILGLPGETLDDYRQTARDIAALPFKAVKLHNLLVLKNTPLAKMFAAPDAEPPVVPLNEYEYALAAAEFLRLLPDNYYIMRLNTDAPENELIAPKWWMKKGQFLEFFKEYYASGRQDAAFQTVKTADGSRSLYHPQYRQHFHTLAGARSEAEKKFVEASGLRRLLREYNCVRLLDVGFGLGYNTLAAINAAEEVKSGKLQITALENDIRVLRAASGLFPQNSRERALIESLPDCGNWRSDFAEVQLLTGDARRSVAELRDKFDCVFMDGFSPDKNPELWTYDFIRELCGILDENGLLVTYSSAYPVRGAMLRCGLAVGETDSFGRKRGGTIAAFKKNCYFNNLPDKELKIILRSTAGSAYRDPGLNDNAKDILERRKRLISRLRRLGIPKWHKDS